MIFQTKDSLEETKKKLTNMLLEFSFPIQMFLMTGDEYLKEARNLPEWWNEPLARKDVLFHADDIDYEEMKRRITKMPLHDEVVYFGDHAVFWGKYTEKEYSRTAYHRLLLKEDFRKLQVQVEHPSGRIESGLSELDCLTAEPGGGDKGSLALRSYMPMALLDRSATTQAV